MTTSAVQKHTTASATANAYPFAVVSVDVGGTKIASALMHYAQPDQAPVVAWKTQVATDAAEGGAAVLQRIVNAVKDVLDHAAEALPGVAPLGIGVATAGRVSAADGSIAYANEIMPSWTGQPVAARLAKETNLPVAVLNDVQGHALGEARWGAARGAQTCLMLAAGTGLGGAVIANGRILRGCHGFAGEVGNVRCLVTGDPVGISGTCAVLESVASGSGIEACYAAASGQSISGADVSARAAAGEPLAQSVILQAGQCLGDAIASLVSVVDPELVVLSGSVTKAGNAWFEAVQHGFESQINDAQKNLPMAFAQLGDNAPLVGAAEHLLDTLVEAGKKTSL